MGLFSRKKKGNTIVEEPAATEVISDNVPMTWRVIPEGETGLADFITAEVELAKEKDETPYIFFGSSMADGSVMMKKFRSKMADAYKGKYIIELDAFSWPHEEVLAVGAKGQVPSLHLVNENNIAGDHFITGDAWGEDTFENIQGPLTDFLLS